MGKVGNVEGSAALGMPHQWGLEPRDADLYTCGISKLFTALSETTLYGAETG